MNWRLPEWSVDQHIDYLEKNNCLLGESETIGGRWRIQYVRYVEFLWFSEHIGNFVGQGCDYPLVPLVPSSFLNSQCQVYVNTPPDIAVRRLLLENVLLLANRRTPFIFDEISKHPNVRKMNKTNVFLSPQALPGGICGERIVCQALEKHLQPLHSRG